MKLATETSNIGGLLLVAFIVLKLTKVINWSWWWVLSPLWVGPAIVLIVGFGYILFRRND